MYFLFRDEEKLKYNNNYSNKLNRPSFIKVATSNRIKVEPYATIVEVAFERLIVYHTKIDSFEQQENN